MKLTVKYQETIEFESGYGVAITSIWVGEDEPERIADIDGEIVEISLENVVHIHGRPMLKGDTNFCYPVDHFENLEDLWVDDTHDLRDRWFATKEEAEAHLKYTMERFHNPQPWESFVKL